MNGMGNSMGNGMSQGHMDGMGGGMAHGHVRGRGGIGPLGGDHQPMGGVDEQRGMGWDITVPSSMDGQVGSAVDMDGGGMSMDVELPPLQIVQMSNEEAVAEAVDTAEAAEATESTVSAEGADSDEDGESDKAMLRD